MGAKGCKGLEMWRGVKNVRRILSETPAPLPFQRRAGEYWAVSCACGGKYRQATDYCCKSAGLMIYIVETIQEAGYEKDVCGD